jgi:hypothetical protein
LLSGRTAFGTASLAKARTRVPVTNSTLIGELGDGSVSFLSSRGAGKALILTPVRGSGEKIPGFHRKRSASDV